MLLSTVLFSGLVASIPSPSSGSAAGYDAFRSHESAWAPAADPGFRGGIRFSPAGIDPGCGEKPRP